MEKQNKDRLEDGASEEEMTAHSCGRLDGFYSGISVRLITKAIPDSSSKLKTALSNAREKFSKEQNSKKQYDSGYIFGKFCTLGVDLGMAIGIFQLGYELYRFGEALIPK